MQTQDVDDIVIRVGALLDDPSNSQFDRDYLMPYIDQEFGELDNELEAVGAQYAQQSAIIDVAAGVKDLSSFMATGQPLAYMKLPTRIFWKLRGQPDVQYQPSSGPVTILNPVATASTGVWQWTFGGGLLAITPSNTAVTLEVYFQELSTNIVDPQENVILGTASLLAVRVAFYVATIRGMTLAAILDKKQMKASRDFKATLVKNRQQVSLVARKTHGRIARSAPAGYI